MAHWLSQLNPIWMFPIIIFGFAALAGIADLIQWWLERGQDAPSDYWN